MTAVSYSAKRSLIPGHTLGDIYDLDLPVLASAPGFERQVSNVTNETLSGVVENHRLAAFKVFNVPLAPLGGNALAAAIEFLDSVEGLEPFLFDFYGSVALPHAAVTARLAKAGYTQQRHTALGGGGSTDLICVTFSIRVLMT